MWHLGEEGNQALLRENPSAAWAVGWLCWRQEAKGSYCRNPGVGSREKEANLRGQKSARWLVGWGWVSLMRSHHWGTGQPKGGVQGVTWGVL